MAHDDRNRGRGRDENMGRGGERGRETQWSGDQSFGGGWGNQTARPQRLGDRDYRREGDDPYAGMERYGSDGSGNFGPGDFHPGDSTPGGFEGPGLDSEFGGPRFDRLDVGSTGTHGAHPVASPFGDAYGGGAGGLGMGSSARNFALMQQQQQQGRQGGSQGGARHDPAYSEWRNRQIEELDRDYEEYCREKQSRFEQEFGAWREQRSQQRQSGGGSAFFERGDQSGSSESKSERSYSGSDEDKGA